MCVHSAVLTDLVDPRPPRRVIPRSVSHPHHAWGSMCELQREWYGQGSARCGGAVGAKHESPPQTCIRQAEGAAHHNATRSGREHHRRHAGHSCGRAGVTFIDRSHRIDEQDALCVCALRVSRSLTMECECHHGESCDGHHCTCASCTGPVLRPAEGERARGSVHDAEGRGER